MNNSQEQTNVPENDKSAMQVSLKNIKQRTLKPLDAWWTVIVVDPPVTLIVYIILKIRIPITPNQVTFMSLVAGGASAYFFCLGQWWHGAWLYQLSFVLDCIDGRIARFKEMSSHLGAWWDAFVNYLVYGLCVAGLAMSDPNNLWLLGGCLLLLVIRVCAGYINELLERPVSGTWSHFVAPKDSLLTRYRLLPLGSFPDKHALLFFLAPVAGFVVIGVLVNVFLEVVLLLFKIKKLVLQLRLSDESEEDTYNTRV